MSSPRPGRCKGVNDELHQAETAFLVSGEPGEFRLSWFTPVAEVALCGHATLASAHWLWETDHPLGAIQTNEIGTAAVGSRRRVSREDADRLLTRLAGKPTSMPRG